MGKGQAFLSEFDKTSWGDVRHLNVVISKIQIVKTMYW
jgi:hypothetical protein